MDDRTLAVLATLIAYKVVLLGIGWVGARRTRDGADFFLAGRSMGPLVAAISASASSSSVWTLLGVSGFAYLNGLSAVWIFPSCVGGFVLNWCWVAPRLRRAAADQGALTLTDFLAGPIEAPGSRTIRRIASLVIVLSFLTYVASQFEGAGKTFAETFGMSREGSLLTGSLIVVAYTLLGGFWAVSLTDTLQGLVMALTALVLPIAGLMAVDGFGGLGDGLATAAAQAEGYDQLFGPRAGFGACLGFVFGLLGIGFGYPGQPHVVNRFMALRDDAALRRARVYSLLWAGVVYAGMILVGLCGRVALEPLADHEGVFLALTNELFPPVVSGVMVAAVLSAIMSTADSQLLVAASSLSIDLDSANDDARSVLRRSRLVILVLSAAAVLIALFGSREIFNKVLFAWNGIGAAFGPLLIVTLWKGRVRPGPSVAAIAAGFALGVLFYSIPETRSSWVERTVPYVGAGLIAWAGRSRR